MKRTPLVFLATGLTLCSCEHRNVIQNKGSDTLVQVAQLWAENYRTVDPDIAVAVTGGGSGVGIASLIDGTVDIANASRKLKPGEVDHAKKKNGTDAVEFIVGFDALAVYVHKDNPIESITIEQLAGIFGEGGETVKWSQLGLDVSGTADEIVLVSRQNSSGTYEYFKEAVLGKRRDYKLGTRDMHGSKDVVDLVSKTPGAIGYSGLAYATDEVKMVPVALKAGNPAVAPSVDSAIEGSYPIARPLFMYTKEEPKGKTKEYLDWILSDAGQKILLNAGYAPVRKLD